MEILKSCIVRSFSDFCLGFEITISTWPLEHSIHYSEIALMKKITSFGVMWTERTQKYCWQAYQGNLQLTQLWVVGKGAFKLPAPVLELTNTIYGVGNEGKTNPVTNWPNWFVASLSNGFLHSMCPIGWGDKLTDCSICAVPNYYCLHQYVNWVYLIRCRSVFSFLKNMYFIGPCNFKWKGLILLLQSYHR